MKKFWQYLSAYSIVVLALVIYAGSIETWRIYLHGWAEGHFVPDVPSNDAQAITLNFVILFGVICCLVVCVKSFVDSHRSK